MRFVGLTVLALLSLPTLVRAADPPSLTSYTLSHSTVYVDATNSDLATTTSIDTAFSEHVKVSIKIISESGSNVKTLYTSSGVTNPTPKIWDGKNTAGAYVDAGLYTIFVVATSTATDLTMSDSSKTVTITRSSTPASSDDSDTTDTATDTTTTMTSSGAPPEYIPIPTLRLVTVGKRTITARADTQFTAVIYDGKGNKRDEAFVTWTFGDGMRRTGANVLHTYYEPGEYLAVVRAVTSDGGDMSTDVLVTVKDVRMTITAVSADGITLMNNDARTLDLSLWRLRAGEQEFQFPSDTKILAGRMTFFSSKVTKLLPNGSASLLYPNGEVAATYPRQGIVPASSEKPSLPQASFNTVQTGKPIIQATENFQAYDAPVNAPTAANELAAVGAVSSPDLQDVEVPIDDVKTPNPLRSSWAVGLLGVILAGSAFIFL